MKSAKWTVTSTAVACALTMGFNSTTSAANSPSATATESKQTTHVHYAQSPGFDKPGPNGTLAPRLQNLGKHTFPVTTTADAQRFINQGVNLAYGFNHMEAGRAFAEAARLDPHSAMAYWGQALVLGPNINAPMDPNNEAQARKLVEHAQALASNVSPRERDYIKALAKRYTANAADRKSNDHAYADAMRTLAKRYPNDLDATALFVEALMDLRPWAYWMGDGKPYPETAEAVAALRSVLRRDPRHPAALHFWVHLWEPTPTPEVALHEADRLGAAVPGAGHLVHMPGHIYLRTGRYQDAIDANVRAAQVDQDYIEQCHVQGFYPLAYYPHNVTFIWMGAMMSGQGKLAIASADRAANIIPDETLATIPMLQSFKVVPLYARIRFGRWDDILAAQKPKYELKFYQGIFHYAHGLAHAARGETKEAQTELGLLRGIIDDPKLNDLPATSTTNDAESMLHVAEGVLAGEIDARRGDFDAAISHLERAVRLEDGLTYNEPADWPEPVRQHLGAVLLAASKPAEAASVYWEDLRRNRENGWSLFGLAEALRKEGKTEDAAVISQRFAKAWKNADTNLNASRVFAER